MYVVLPKLYGTTGILGFMVDGAMGAEENGKERMVNTPWSKEPIPFSIAAQIGTEKVIEEHSTIGVVVTTDGSFAEDQRLFHS